MQFFKKLTVVLFACGSLLFAKASLAVTYVCMDTTLGTFCMEMLEEDAPGTVANFLNYVRDGDYNQTFIHRTVPSFVIQGGGYQLPPEAAEVPSNGEIPNEFKVPNTRGTVAMAKLADQPNSATSEWFINLTTNVDLDTSNGGYTVFAKIVSGLPVVDAIGNAQRVNLTGALGPVFNEVPIYRQDSDGVSPDDLIIVKRAYITDTLPADPENPFQCTADWISSIQPVPSKVCMDTSFGTFCIDLFPDDAPVTVANFLHYVVDGDYNNTIFHRSVTNFVVQGGGIKLNPLFSSVPADPTIINEFKVSNTRGTIAMAKSDGSPNSAASQWFVNTKDNSVELDANNGGFTAFGRVDDAGMAIIDQIAALRIWNLNADGLQPQMEEVPLKRSNIAGDLNLGDFVKISNAYVPNLGPNPCFPVKPAALTEHVNGKFEVPVRVGPNMYMVIFERDLNNEGFVYRANLNKIRSMVDRGQEAAVFTPADGLLVIPSVLINGSVVLTNVKLRLTDPSILQFTVEGMQP